MESNKSTENAELYQEGCTPVQFFLSRAIPVLPDTPLEPRRGRPSRTAAKDQQSAAQAGDSLAPTTSEAVEQLKSQIITLSDAERADLACFLLTSLEPAPLTEAQKQDLQRRLTDYEANRHTGSTWDEVKARLQER